MLDFISRLRHKDEAFKKKVAFIASGFLTAFVFFIWATSFYSQLFSPQSSNQTIDASGQMVTSSSGQDVNTSSSSLSPFSTAFDTVKQGFTNMQAGIGDLLKNNK